MKHLALELFTITVWFICLQYKVVTVSFNPRPIHKNARQIAIWLAGILLSVIISSWFE